VCARSLSGPTIGEIWVGPRQSNQKTGLMKDRVDRLAQGQNHEPGPPAWAAAAAIATSPQRRPRLSRKLPSDILTLQSKGHLNLVATVSVSKMLGREQPEQHRSRDGRHSNHIDQVLCHHR
jgi:hypothetical protein